MERFIYDEKNGLDSVLVLIVFCYAIQEMVIFSLL